MIATTQLHHALQKIIRQTDEENKRCADCNTPNPTWASINIGCFLCLECSGIHRNLGTHISKVRSTELDTWKPEWVANMKKWGNARVNAVWEAKLPRDYAAYRSIGRTVRKVEAHHQIDKLGEFSAVDYS